jgi:hypothetical protein
MKTTPGVEDENRFLPSTEREYEEGRGYSSRKNRDQGLLIRDQRKLSGMPAFFDL